ncbi:MAG: hypothetical protein AWT59_1997 [Candidatus Gallionella acididurans]|uniref:Uncharacterized protein n=1 Tax=Candidatus Gallionella acididurans TaxID=1796491 RepID=A0A139BSY6_9PROT|nr:MAG: hypothetical protein AWT59_1997 [Candidatus Gallionella acididurans]
MVSFDTSSVSCEEYSASSRDDIALVFVRNLVMQDPHMIASIKHHHIDSDI